MVSSIFQHQPQRSSSSLIMPSATQKMAPYSTTVSPTHRNANGSFLDSACYLGFVHQKPRVLSLSANVDFTCPLQVETSVEYDLPAHIYPPKNAEPILMVDHDYMNRTKKKKSSSRQSSGSGSLNFLAAGSIPGIGTSPASSSALYNSSASERLRHNVISNHNSSVSSSNTSSRSRKSTPLTALCECGCGSNVIVDPYTKSGAYTTQSSKSSKVVHTVNLTDSPVPPPPAYQARATPRSSKKSKVYPQQLQQQQQFQRQQHPAPTYQQAQTLVYPVPPPSYATATNAYGSFHHSSLCSSICPTLCAGCTTPMVGAGPPELVPHGFSTAHVVRSRGSPKLRSRRHLTGSTASVPEYHRRPRSNTIGHTSASATQHHNSIPTSFLNQEPQVTTSHSRLLESHVNQPSLMRSQTELQEQHKNEKEGKVTTKRRVLQNTHSYDFDIFEARVAEADTAQMYSAPITPAELMEEDAFGRGVTEMDTSSGFPSYHGSSNSSKASKIINSSNGFLSGKTSAGFSLQPETSVASRIYAHEKAMEAKTNSSSGNANSISGSSRQLRKNNSSSSSSSSSRNISSGTVPVNNLTSTSNVSSDSNNSNSSISVSSHQYLQQQQQQQQSRSHQQHNQFLSQLFRQQEYLKTSTTPTQSSSSALSTPSRISGLTGHHDLSTMGQDSNSLGGGSSFSGSAFGTATTPINYRDFLLDNVLMASSPQPSATTLFSSPLATHIASQLLGVPTPPQSNSMPSVPVPSVSGSNRFLAGMYHLNMPPYNLAY